MIIKLLLLFIIYGFLSTDAQSDNSETLEVNAEDVLGRASIPCQTKEKTRGYCLSVLRCSNIMNNIRRFQNPNICFFEGDMPHVCCPVRLRRPGQPTPRPTRPPRTTTRLSRPSSPTRRPTSFSTRGPNYSSVTRVDINLDGCGKRIHEPAQGSAFVVGGKEAEKYSWPWMAAIRGKTFGENTGFLCGGSLITPRHVLTAAHCFEGQLNGFRRPSDYKIILGSHYRASDTPNYEEQEEGIITVSPISIKLHEDYNSNSNDNDVAVITLDTNVPMTDRVRPVCLPTRMKPYNSNSVTIIGWGDTSFGGVGSNTLQEADFEVVSFSRCRRLFRPLPAIQITENMLCAGDLSGASDACQNDSGGPLLTNDVEQNKYIQVGIVSFGYRCAERGFPGVYTRVANYVPWIQRQIRR